MISVRELRAHLGLSQTEFGRRIGVHKHTVINWERNYTHPSRLALIRLNALSRQHNLHKPSVTPVPITRYDDSKMLNYAQRPANWNKLNGQQKSAFYSRRSFYARIRRDIEAGRVMGEPTKRD